MPAKCDHHKEQLNTLNDRYNKSNIEYGKAIATLEANCKQVLYSIDKQGGRVGELEQSLAGINTGERLNNQAIEVFSEILRGSRKEFLETVKEIKKDSSDTVRETKEEVLKSIAEDRKDRRKFEYLVMAILFASLVSILFDHFY